MHFPYDEVYHTMRIWYKENTPTYRKKVGTNFPGFPCAMGFATFFHALGN